MNETVTKIEASDLDPMIREVNKGLMVAWINRELLDRASHDVRKSIVLLDGDKTFVHAVMELPDEATLQRLYDDTVVEFWSVGV